MIIKIIKTLLILLTLMAPLQRGYAQSQMPDRLIYQGDTLEIYSNPLESFKNIDSLRNQLMVNDCNYMYCYRKYIAEWEISENQLYLTHLYTCCFDAENAETRKEKIDLQNTFGPLIRDGRIAADWVTDDLHSPQGKIIEYVNLDYQSFHETQVLFKIQNGILQDIDTFDNSKSKPSEYSKNGYEKLYQTLYGNIHWDSLPHVGSFHNDWSVLVHVKFSANESGQINSILILKMPYETEPLYDLYREEALRAMKTIPEWDVYYRYGKHERRFVNISIRFTKENRDKYKR